jgi:hypothetical protein
MGWSIVRFRDAFGHGTSTGNRFNTDFDFADGSLETQVTFDTTRKWQNADTYWHLN